MVIALHYKSKSRAEIYTVSSKTEEKNPPIKHYKHPHCHAESRNISYFYQYKKAKDITNIGFQAGERSDASNRYRRNNVLF